MKQITNLSDAEFKILVIKILKELIEYDNNIKEEMKFTLSEIYLGINLTREVKDLYS